jgi:hypothetical protein
MLCKPIRCFSVLFDDAVNCWHFTVWVTDEWMKEENRWDYIDRRKGIFRTTPCKSSTLCTKTPTLTDLWLNPRLSIFRYFKYLIQIWIFVHSKWQKINWYTLTGNGAWKFLLKWCHNFFVKMFLFFPRRRYCKGQFVYMYIITCIK